AGLQIHNVNPQAAFSVGDLQIQPYPVPHDAREPCHYVFSNGHCRVGTLSDAGSVTESMCETLSGCDALTLEFNYDAEMLANGPYPPPLRARIAGPFGHLSNAQAADLLKSLDRSRLKQLVLTHLSEKNNTPGHARAACVAALGCEPSWLQVAHQENGLAWRVLS
ncbi:MAG: MBL fold metallo-hydrolase, partial [Nevskiales bacterium]|nr:MBL fold metallo-hydrolase [Nevskiales bacterium]